MSEQSIKVILSEIIKEGKKDFAIYPFGENGIKTKELLNKQYNIKEALIVDNNLAKTKHGIVSLEEVENYEKYTWLLTCANPAVRDEIYATIEKLVPAKNLVYMFGTPLSDEFRKYRILSALRKPMHKYISAPCNEVLELVKQEKQKKKNITVAEIGIGIGATSLEICKLLRDQDVYYGFDFEDSIDALIEDLNEFPGIECELVGKGNSRKTFDSYSWNLCNMLFQMRNDNRDGLFDIVYLDGAHSFFHDGLACCLLKELIKSGGYIVFDDMDWTYGKSPVRNPKVRPETEQEFTSEQIEDEQITRVVKAFMVHDIRFKETHLEDSKPRHRAIYMKI